MKQRLRVVVLYAELAGYINACLRTLHEAYDTDLLVFRNPPVAEAPFNEALYGWMPQLYNRKAHTDAEMLQRIEQFAPDAVFMSGWFDVGYLKVARTLKKRGVPVIAGIDTQWTGTARQHVGAWMAPWYLHSAIDVLWGAGERQRFLANRMGFAGNTYWDGVYSCDWDHFARSYKEQVDDSSGAFLYVGRYAEVKGLDTLLYAYAQYRETVKHPWELHTIGTGPLKDVLARAEGVVDHGFIQPEELPAYMADRSAFVLPSRHEPWGVVLHEAAAVGLPLLCSDACGAGVHLVRNGFNGYVFGADDVGHLSRRMQQLASLPKKELELYRRHSHWLSQQYTPALWAQALRDGVMDLQAERA